MYVNIHAQLVFSCAHDVLSRPAVLLLTVTVMGMLFLYLVPPVSGLGGITALPWGRT